MTNYTRLVTVTSAASSQSLTTLLNVKTDLGVDDSNPSIDIYLGRLIKQTSASVSLYCNRVFAFQTYREVLRRSDNSVSSEPEAIKTFHSPLVSVTSVVEDDTTLSAAAGGYELDTQQSKLWRLDSSSNRTAWAGSTITIVYKAGWNLPGSTTSENALLTTAPDIEDAVIRLIKSRYLARDRDPFLKVDEVAGVGSQQYWVPDTNDGNFPPEVRDILDNYRMIRVA